MTRTSPITPGAAGTQEARAGAAVDVSDLHRSFGEVRAVRGVDLRIAPGEVVAFLGPNGAGKSTTLRMLTGLTPPTSGSVAIAGSAYADLPNPGRLVGVMLDAAAMHPGRTGLETLRIAARLLGMRRDRAGELLERVGLADAGDRRVGNYSLGMRQRLGIASALLGDPAVLVLDEPANGMDPEGIRWMRGLLHEFAAGGGTVLLSSHLLGEVQATVDRLVVIGDGRVVADDSLANLLAGTGTVVRALDMAALATALRRAGLDPQPREGGSLRVLASAEDVGRIAAGSGAVLLELGDGGGLEELFFSLTRSGGAAPVAA